MRFTPILLILLSALRLQAQEVEKITLADLQELINTTSSNTRIFNFWASWCGPCVKEMPHFEKLAQSDKAEVILVSLDFPKDLQKASEILKKKQISLKSYLLDETDYDKYIPTINKNWSGAIPASLVINQSGEQFFYEQSFNEAELKAIVEKHTRK